MTTFEDKGPNNNSNYWEPDNYITDKEPNNENNNSNDRSLYSFCHTM
jgi:hypothetical protein